MKQVKPRTLSGFMELLPHDQVYFKAMVDILEETYQLYGFTPLDTPILEASEVLLAKGGGETEKQIYRFTKGDSDLSMRFDLTVPLAKYVAMHQGELSFPFRRYQIGKVYRGERPQRGRFREFYQADIDILGSEHLALENDAEMPSVIYHIFHKLGVQDFVIRLNNRKILSGFYQMQNLGDSSTEIMHAMDKLDKTGEEPVLKLLSDLGVAQPEDLLTLMKCKGKPSEVLESLASYLGKNELFDLGVSELKTVCDTLADLGVSPEHYIIDLSIARGLDYYTGTVYETTLSSHPQVGSVCSGGRYDNLADYYTNKKLPGVGISIGLTRLFHVLQQEGYLNQEKNHAPCTVLILPMDVELSHCVKTASVLRNGGISTQVYMESKKFKQKIAYADKIAVPFVLILGQDEVAQGRVTLRNMETGKQEALTLEEAVALLLASAKAPIPPISMEKKEKT